MSKALLKSICEDEDDHMAHLKVRCNHGRLLPLQTSWSKNNPGRRYWSCPYYGDMSCKFFRWRDGEIDKRSKFVLPRLVDKLKELEEGIVFLHDEENVYMDIEEPIEMKSYVKKKNEPIEKVKPHVKKRNICSTIVIAWVVIVLVVCIGICLDKKRNDPIKSMLDGH